MNTGEHLWSFSSTIVGSYKRCNVIEKMTAKWVLLSKFKEIFIIVISITHFDQPLLRIGLPINLESSLNNVLPESALSQS